MSSQLLTLLASISGYGLALVGLIVAIKLSRPSKLDAIPTVGSSSWLGSYWAGLRFMTNGMDVIQEGYEKHKPASFKVAELYRWTVVLCSRKSVEELRSAPDDVLSFVDDANERFHVKYTMGPQIHDNPYHTLIVRSQLTRNIGALYPEIRNEIITAFDDVLDLKGNDWKSMPALSSVQQVVCRTSNRIFVGLPLCRDPDWIDLNIQHTIDVIKGGIIIGLFPDFLKPMATRFFTNVSQSNERGRKLLCPIVEERQKYLNECGNGWADKPNDFLSWLMEEAEGPESTVMSLTIRILTLNFAAIHTSSQTFTRVLFYLAANPQYIKPLREEVEGIIGKEGWSKVAIGQMWKVDSFIKECQRLGGTGGLLLGRKAVKDYTFSDGTFVPKGTSVGAPARSIHHDEMFYENAHAFDPFRFANLREEDGESMKHQFVSTTAEYLTFGHGRHACPGRFFAASELKTMLAHTVVMYDVKLADNTTHPPSLRIATSTIPDPSAKVMFRRRVD